MTPGFSLVSLCLRGNSVPITIISTTLSSIKTALDIGTFIVKSDSALDRAILKQKIEGMMDSLSEAKKTIRELDVLLYEKDKKIRMLRHSSNGNLLIFNGDHK